jgi:endoglucanase
MIGRAVVLALALLLLAAAPPGKGPLRGVNLSGAELNPDKLPGRVGQDYVYPTLAELDQAKAAGMTVIRLPVLWERLQPALFGPLDQAELGRVRAVIDEATRRGLRVIIDAHDYGTYRGAKVGSAGVPTDAFAAFWGRVAEAFATDPAVIFGLMNEPHDIEAVRWARAEQAAIDAIRGAGARNLVLVSGTGWDGAHNFVSGRGYGEPNAVALAGLRDPADNIAFEVHQYLDPDHSGTHPECMTPDAANRVLAPFTDWLRAGGRRGFLGEVGAAATPQCLASLTALLGQVNANPDAWLGWAYWAGGPWWGEYMFSIEPKDGRERPQMAALRRLAETGQPRADRREAGHD